ncbi:MAG: hypothetical protein E7417_03535 [Ruminococcaceae bacterium]|nr:hypothetical protein [Oscillospiraceae bacterium]
MNDTEKLLKECNAGIKMGVSSIEEVLDNVKGEKLKEILASSKEEHQRLGSETREILERFDMEGKEPNLMAKGMSWLKTNVMISMDDSDNTIADLITDGCNMGVKSLNKYLNQYKAADEKAKDITKKLINMEASLAEKMREYL